MLGGRPRLFGGLTLLRSGHEGRRPCCAGATLALAFALVLAADEAVADVLLRCSTSEVVITSGPRGEATARRKVDLTFRINAAAKTVALGGAPVTVSRFGRAWITAEHDDVIYDLDRQRNTLSYAARGRVARLSPRSSARARA